VKKYFEKYNIKYLEKNIFTTPLTRDDIFKMLYNSEGGFEDIISTRSNIYKERGHEIENMKLHELVDFIVANPSILKRPIIVTDYELQVGYNDDDIELFLPEEVRNSECEHCFKEEPCEYEKAIKIAE
jgi:regulatory protein spx